MTFIAQDMQDAASEAQQPPKAAVPGFRLADAFTSSRTLGNLNQATTAKLAASMAGMIPRDFNARLATSMAGMIPKDFSIGLAESAGVAKIVKDLSETHAGILRSAMPQLSLMQSLTTSGVLREVIEEQARLAAIARITPSDSISNTEFGTTLSRDSERLLFGNFVYCFVLSLVLLAYIRITGENETDSQIISLLTFATGLGARQIAKRAREAAFRAYDFMYPPE